MAAATRKPKGQVKVRPVAVVKPPVAVKPPPSDKKAKLVAALKRLHPMD
jgi:hypothetical protein